MPDMTAYAWVLPLVSGMADAFLRNFITFPGRHLHHFVLTAAGYLLALPYYVVWLWLAGMPEVQPTFWFFIGIEIPLLTAAQILTVRAHKLAPLALTVPLHATLPALLLLTSWLMKGRMPTWWGAVGVLILTAGLYTLNLVSKKERVRWSDPLWQVLREPGLRCMLGAVGLYSITSNLDYDAWQSANAPFFLLMVHGACGTISLLLALWYARAGRLSHDEVDVRGLMPMLIMYGFVMMLSVVPQIWSFSWIAVMPYVIAEKRTGAILFAIGMGIAVSLLPRYAERHKEEREYLQYRIPGTLIMVGGMVLIILYGT